MDESQHPSETLRLAVWTTFPSSTSKFFSCYTEQPKKETEHLVRLHFFHP